MRFLSTSLSGVFLLEPEKLADDRGSFARTWCSREYTEQGLDPRVAQCSVSNNIRRGTVRGLHYQTPPFAESKTVRCTSGALYDVALDLRPDSPTFLRWHGATLSRENGRMLYMPRGVAHGFQTLADDTEILYVISEFYSPPHARGVRWDDPLFSVSWPEPVTMISERDRAYPDSSRNDFRELSSL